MAVLGFHWYLLGRSTPLLLGASGHIVARKCSLLYHACSEQFCFAKKVILGTRCIEAYTWAQTSRSPKRGKKKKSGCIAVEGVVVFKPVSEVIKPLRIISSKKNFKHVPACRKDINEASG